MYHRVISACGVLVLAVVAIGCAIAEADETPSALLDRPGEYSQNRSINDLGLGAHVSLPIGPFSDVAKTGFGVGAQLRHRVGSNVSLLFVAGVDRFGPKDEPSDRDVGTISSEFGYGGLDIEMVRGPKGAEFGTNSAAGVIVAVGMTGFDSEIHFESADADVHFSENAFAATGGVYYIHTVGQSGAIRVHVTGNHAFSTQGDSRVSFGLLWMTAPWFEVQTQTEGTDVSDLTGGVYMFGFGPTCNYPSFGRYSDEVAHGFGVSGRIIKDIRAPIGFFNSYNQAGYVPNMALFVDANAGFLKPTLEYDVDGIDEEAGSFSLGIGSQFFIEPNRNVMPYLQGSVEYHSVTNERTSEFAQLPSYDHSESGFNLRIGFGARTRLTAGISLDFSLDTPVVGFGYDDHSETPGWDEYKPHETRMKSMVMFDLTKLRL